MRALTFSSPAQIETAPLVETELPVRDPGPSEILVKVSVCGVCRTDLHIVEGDIPQKNSPLVPGHQAVGTVCKLGGNASRFKLGDRVGVPWLGWTCGKCEFCSAGRENLCASSIYTGYHVDGGYAEYVTVQQDFAYALPQTLNDEEVAPLLCAGIIGYRALKRANCPKNGKLGILGFGSSAHITLQIAKSWGITTFVVTREERHSKLADKLGADWSALADSNFPEPLDSIIVFAPAGELVPFAMRSLKSGGRVSLAGIHMSNIPSMEYSSCLFHEKELVSIEANTRVDGEELLQAATRINLHPHVVSYNWLQANEVLKKLKSDAFEGSAVLRFQK
jgi:alcohol dehydrogenase, propanol-preferring